MTFSNLYLYQIVVIIVSVIMIFQGFQRFAKRESGQTIFKLLLRIAVWGGMVGVVIFPKFTYQLAHSIGITGNINAVILTGFLLVFLMIFKLLSAIERLEQNISELTRKDSLKEIKKEK